MDYVQYLYDMLFGGPKIDSEGQLRAAQQQAQKDSVLDQEARAAGFNNGAEYMAYLRQRQTPTGGTAKARAPAGISAAMAWHPKNTIGRADAALRGATGGN